MGVIISFVAPADVGLDEIDTAASLITSTAHPEANIIWGARFDPNLTDEFKVTVVATGFTNQPSKSVIDTKIDNGISPEQNLMDIIGGKEFEDWSSLINNRGKKTSTTSAKPAVSGAKDDSDLSSIADLLRMNLEK